MTNQNLITICFSEIAHEYEIEVGAVNLANLGEFTRLHVSPSARRVGIVSNAKVFGLYGKTAVESLEKAGFQTTHFLMPDGEKHKNWRVLEKVLQFFSESKLTRADCVVALGGGVVGDLGGFAAAIYQRGLPLIQVPTTFLAQIDSSVGGKTAVNSNFGKNLIGAFHQPHGVLIDVATLKTLPQRELRAGLFESVKHGAIGGEKLFAHVSLFLQEYPPEKFNRLFKDSDFLENLINLIRANIEFKARVVAGDEREDVDNRQLTSRKILNFGHTVGHALEKVTNYKKFKHGEAVGIGMKAAVNLSKRLGKLNENSLNWFYDVLHSVGKLPNAENIKPEEIIAAFAHDKKSSRDSFDWILLEEIGRTAIVSHREIPESIINEAIFAALKN